MCSPSSLCRTIWVLGIFCGTVDLPLTWLLHLLLHRPLGHRGESPCLHLPAASQPGRSGPGHCMRDTGSVLLHTAVGSCSVYLFKHLGQGRRLCRDLGQHELKSACWHRKPQPLEHRIFLSLFMMLVVALREYSLVTVWARQPHPSTPRETGWLCCCPSLGLD